MDVRLGMWIKIVRKHTAEENKDGVQVLDKLDKEAEDNTEDSFEVKVSDENDNEGLDNINDEDQIGEGLDEVDNTADN